MAGVDRLLVHDQAGWGNRSRTCGLMAPAEDDARQGQAVHGRVAPARCVHDDGLHALRARLHHVQAAGVVLLRRARALPGARAARAGAPRSPSSSPPPGVRVCDGGPRPTRPALRRRRHALATHPSRARVACSVCAAALGGRAPGDLRNGGEVARGRPHHRHPAGRHPRAAGRARHASPTARAVRGLRREGKPLSVRHGACARLRHV